MKSFSERMGLKPVRVAVQKESVDEELRNYLWNALSICYFDGLEVKTYRNDNATENMLNHVWMSYFHSRIDEMPDFTRSIVEKIKKCFLSAPWNEMFDLLEFIPSNYDDEYDDEKNVGFYDLANNGLEKFMSAYRFVDGLITEITSEEEITAIEIALNSTNAFSGVQMHLRRALELLTDRKEPDYRNSVKESISAVEALAKIISGKPKDTLAASLDKIKGKIKLHKALEQGFKNIYGYTSDESGIRHALTDEPNCEMEDAKFMLVSCSAFINYLIVKSEKAGIELGSG